MIRRPPHSIAALALGALCLCTAAAAEGIPDRARILACLSENTRTPEVCRALLLAPCTYRQSQGLARACSFRLRRQWEWLLDAEIDRHRSGLAAEADQRKFDREVDRWTFERKDACPLPRDDPKTASTRRNECRILDLAIRWHSLTQQGR